MNRRLALYLLALGLAMLAGFGLFRTNDKDSPRKQVKARTIIVQPEPAPPPIRKDPDPVELQELPDSEKSLLTGSGGLDSASYFRCTLTNQGTWTVKELRLRIAAGQPEGITRWERNYTEVVRIPPGAVEHISFKVTDGAEAETLWKIIGARGFRAR